MPRRLIVRAGPKAFGGCDDPGEFGEGWPPLSVAGVVVLAGLASGGAAKASQIDPMPGLIIQEMIRQIPPQTFCEPPMIYSKRLGRCVFPEPVQVQCDPPAKYSRKLKRCIYPEPVHEPAQIQCEPPSKYSRKLGRCIFPQPDPPSIQVFCDPPSTYSKRLGRCIFPEPIHPVEPIEPVRVTCEPPYRYSPRRNECYLPDEPKPPTRISCKWPKVNDGNSCICAAGYSTLKGKCVEQKKPPTQVTDITRIQQCLAQLGYEPGPADGKSGKATRVAYREFQRANGLASGRRTLPTDQPRSSFSSFARRRRELPKCRRRSSAACPMTSTTC